MRVFPLLLIAAAALGGAPLAGASEPRSPATDEAPTEEISRAHRMLLKTAENGDPAAQLRLGDLYWDGLGFPKDRDEARHWYRRAADQGLEEAARRLERD